MKGDIPLIAKIAALAFALVVLFYLGKQWPEPDGYQRTLFFGSRPSQPSVAVSPNANRAFDISSLISNQSVPVSDPALSDPSALPPPPPPPPDRFGIVDQNGTMTNDFDVGVVGQDPIESSGNRNSTEGTDESGGTTNFQISDFQLCNESMREYIPCLDNVEAIRKLKSTKKGEKYERHCPEEGKGLDCLVPPPKGYKTPIPWPKSREEVNFCAVISDNCRRAMRFSDSVLFVCLVMPAICCYSPRKLQLLRVMLLVGQKCVVLSVYFGPSLPAEQSQFLIYRPYFQ